MNKGLIIIKASVLFIFLVFIGCSNTLASIENLNDNQCGVELQNGINQILMGQGIKISHRNEIIDDDSIRILSNASAKDRNGLSIVHENANGKNAYHFMFKNSNGKCKLNLFSKDIGSFNITNTITYIDSRLLPNCRCEEL